MRYPTSLSSVSRIHSWDSSLLVKEYSVRVHPGGSLSVTYLLTGGTDRSGSSVNNETHERYTNNWKRVFEFSVLTDFPPCTEVIKF